MSRKSDFEGGKTTPAAAAIAAVAAATARIAAVGTAAAARWTAVAAALSCFYETSHDVLAGSPSEMNEIAAFHARTAQQVCAMIAKVQIGIRGFSKPVYENRSDLVE